MISRFFAILGPGLLLAAAAVGVSHLVQSTRAGANFGYQLLLLVILVNFFKYPFFEFGHRYFAATGETLLEGYKKLGKHYLYIFLVLNFITAMGSVAAVTFVTAALLQNMISDAIGIPVWSGVILALCLAILAIGHYKWLDRLIKVLMVVLVLATVFAVTAALWHGPVAPPEFVSPSPWTWATLPFLIALMGWMPAPIELSVWQSLWMEARDRNFKQKTSLNDALVDFNVGYFLTVFLAIGFILLGALVMHGSGSEFSGTAVSFAGQVVHLYTDALGAWAEPVIALAAFVTMFSTTLTLVDAYPRSLSDGTRFAFPSLPIPHRPWHIKWVILTCIIALVIISFFKTRLKDIVDVVTTVAFLAGPFFAYINYRLLTSEHTPQEMQPGPFLRGLSIVGLVLLTGFGLVFVVHRFFF